MPGYLAPKSQQGCLMTRLTHGGRGGPVYNDIMEHGICTWTYLKPLDYLVSYPLSSTTFWPPD